MMRKLNRLANCGVLSIVCDTVYIACFIFVFHQLLGLPFSFLKFLFLGGQLGVAMLFLCRLARISQSRLGFIGCVI